jgi:D-alanyl-D-alanine carboxypeptidase (penicillin-binding protein 5/6)
MISFRSTLQSLTIAALLINTSALIAENNLENNQVLQTRVPVNKPLITPSPPTVNSKAYILIDANTGKIIAEKSSEERLPPASLTKMMTLYVVSNALHNGQIHLNDNVRISHDAWKSGGSRMFVKEGQEVSIQDLLKGIIVDSGNDACAAIAEHLGGSENGFAEIMNQQAQNIGMKGSHFTDSTGLPDENHYTTAKDLAILGRALVNDFPEYYKWYKEKWFTFNDIRQPNRNRLLWRNGQVDGIKTGHTSEAGFCLVSSAKRDNMRLISVVLGAPSDSVRADDSERLLNYGFRFFETHALYKAGQPIVELDVYKGDANKLKAGVLQAPYITIPTGQYQRLSVKTKIRGDLIAPIHKNTQIGDILVQYEDKVIQTYPLYALEEVQSGGFFARSKDAIRLMFRGWFG